MIMITLLPHAHSFCLPSFASLALPPFPYPPFPRLTPLSFLPLSLQKLSPALSLPLSRCLCLSPIGRWGGTKGAAASARIPFGVRGWLGGWGAEGPANWEGVARSRLGDRIN
jgi:hypothetical protein